MDEKKIERYVERAWERHLAGFIELPESFSELGLYGIGIRERTQVVLETLELVFVRPDNLRNIGSIAQQDAQQWRLEPLGVDSVNRTYWLLCGDRLYRETPKKSLAVIEKRNREAGINSRRSTRLAEHRGPSVDPPRHDDIEDDGALWELLCASYEEWVYFPNVLEQSTAKADRTVYRRVCKVAPGITARLHNEIKKQEMQELLVSRKRSTRIAKKEAIRHQREIIEQEEQDLEHDYRRSKRLRHSDEEEPTHPMLVDTRDLRAQRREQARLEALEREQMKKIEMEHSEHQPPPLPPAEEKEVVAMAKDNDEGGDVEESWMFACACGKAGHNYDDGRAMTACEKCLVWSHLGCSLRAEARRLGREIDEDEWEQLSYRDMSIDLTAKESQICDLLDRVVEHIHDTHPEQPKLVLRIAGGWVRDKLLGMESHDIDIAIDHMSGFDLAQHVNQYLADNNYPVHSIAKISQNPERSKHLETATTSVLDQLVDFVNLRSETYNSNSRIPVVEFGTPTEDAYRRDITINALFYNIHSRQVEDFTGKGLEDLKNGIIRTPLAPFETFRDDPLRVLRVIRFASRFRYEIEKGTAEALSRQEIKEDLDVKISRERVGVELEKMAAGPNPLLSIQMLLRFGLYTNVFRAPAQDLWVDGQMQDTAESETLTKCVLDIVERGAEILHGVPSTYTIGPIARRHLILAAYMYPYRGATAKDKKKVLPVTHLVIRDGIKLSNAEVDATLCMHSFASKISDLVGRCVAGTLDRKTLGLQIREIGPRWSMAVAFSAAVELLDGRPLDEVIERFGAYVSMAVSQGVVEAFKEKHIVDGKGAAKLLGIKPGPAIKGILEQVMEWQLEFPEGTKQECEKFLMENGRGSM
ncbi:CCA tRNA nucleotidyltransferase, mitochondrial [Linderina macrospora]|uniref:CCA tRNA nucleotidyltransferase, mitochondrial n=1 Tax=Linderina macrospora TaxID=4868 RepID=A0ACC1JFC2_9FUNG|nr:CCA tRNA nucleotidyltransferase, mitochondrial [Linderina macrospora]